MKLAVAFIVLLAGAFALPQTSSSSQLAALEDAIITRQDERFIDGIIIGIIEGIIENIPDNIFIDKRDWSTEPVDGLTLYIGGEELLITGISDIFININFSLFVLTYDLYLPRISISLAHGYAGATIAGTVLDGELNGNVAIIEPRIKGRARVGLVGGVQVREFNAEISLEAIESNLNLRVLNEDLSDLLNKILSETIPGFIVKYNDTLNEYVSRILFFIINLIL